MYNVKLKLVAGIVMSFIAMPVFAEAAPVYDADDIQQQLDPAVEPEQDLPPPPPPGQETMFVPRSNANSPAGVTNPSAGMSLDQRIRRVEQQVNTIQSSNASARVESLQSEVQSLRGQVEQLTHQIQQLQSQQKTLYSDLDKRLAQNKTPDIAAPSPAPAPVTKMVDKAVEMKTEKEIAKAAAVSQSSDASEQPNVAEEQQIYQSAYNLIKEKKYPDAVKVLQDMLQKYPSGQFASNAHYWLGELYGLMGKNDDALSEFSIVAQRYPDSPRVSDAQLKIGLLYATQTKWSEARAAFKKVINRYPGTASSRLASEQLKQIKEAGH